MNPQDWLVHEFEANRSHLRSLAYRMLGSLSEADDAIQEAWLRLSRSDTAAVENLTGWLTTVVARICLNMLQARRSRREELSGMRIPEPIVTPEDQLDPEYETLLSDSVGLALMVVLETLTPAERLAFVLHDMFAVPFTEIAPIVDRSPEAARQLASRARRRVQGAGVVSDMDLTRQREVVAAFVAASREGNFEALVAVLDPDVVLRADRGAVAGERMLEISGARNVAKSAQAFSRRLADVHPALVNGAPGVVAVEHGQPLSVLGFVVRGGKITEIDVFADPERLQLLNLTILG